MAEIRIYCESSDKTFITIDGQKVKGLVHYRLEQGVNEGPILWLAINTAIYDKVTVKGKVASEDIVVGAMDQIQCAVCQRFKDICICANGPTVKETTDG